MYYLIHHLLDYYLVDKDYLILLHLNHHLFLKHHHFLHHLHHQLMLLLKKLNLIHLFPFHHLEILEFLLLLPLQ